MTEEEAIKKMREWCFTRNLERNHTLADYIIREFVRELGYTDLAALYISVDKA